MGGDEDRWGLLELGGPGDISARPAEAGNERLGAALAVLERAGWTARPPSVEALLRLARGAVGLAVDASTITARDVWLERARALLGEAGVGLADVSDVLARYPGEGAIPAGIARAKVQKNTLYGTMAGYPWPKDYIYVADPKPSATTPPKVATPWKRMGAHWRRVGSGYPVATVRMVKEKEISRWAWAVGPPNDLRSGKASTRQEAQARADLELQSTGWTLVDEDADEDDSIPF